MHLLHLPKLGYTMENGAITDWLVGEGSTFDVGAPLYEVETEKNVVQVEARLPGTLVRVVATSDEALEVGELIAVIADPGEQPTPDDIAAAIAGDGGHGSAGAGASAEPGAAPVDEAPDDGGSVSVGSPGGVGDAAGETDAVGSGIGPGVAEVVDDTAQHDAPAEGPAALAAPPSGRVRALPKVRAAADRLGVDLATLSGTGPRGTLTVDDVERAAAAGGAGGARGSSPVGGGRSAGGSGGGGSGADGRGTDGAGSRPSTAEVYGETAVLESRTLAGVRKAMAAAVTRSWADVPQFVQQLRVDMTAVNAYRAGKKEKGGKVGITAVLAAAIAHAAAVVPEVNATLSGTELTLFSDVNVAVAVSSERGLVVPTVARVQSAGIDEVEARVQAVVSAARGGSLPTDVVPTITLSNLGGYGVETGMPLVTTPQAAIVFLGDIIDTTVVVDGQVAVRPLLGIAVGYDHRIVDGATGGEFCRALREVLEHPERLDTPARDAATAGSAS